MLHNQNDNVRLAAFTCVCAFMLFALGVGNQMNVQQKAELKEDKKGLEEDLSELRNHVTSLEEKAESLSQQVEQKTEENLELKNTIEEKTDEIEDITAQKEKLKKENSKMKKEQKYSKKKTMNVTMYTAGYESTQKRKGEPGYGITASGKPVQEGVTIACPPEIPFGTRITIEGFGERVCQDRGGAITSGHLDVYTSDLKKAKKFGRQDLEVTIHGKQG